MRLAWVVAVLLVPVVAGCATPRPSSTATPAATTTSSSETLMAPALPGHAGATAKPVAADLRFHALYYSCVGPFAALEWDPLYLDLHSLVAADLNLTWDPGPLQIQLVFAFTDAPHDPILAQTQGASPVRWQPTAKEIEAIRHGDRLEPIGPVCGEQLPAYFEVDTVVHVQGTLWTS